MQIAKIKINFDWHDLGKRLLKYWRFVWGRTPSQRLFRYYFLVVLFGAILLITPIAVKTYDLQPVFKYNSFHYYKWNFFYALFVAASGFSDTGMTMTNISAQFTTFGQIVILFLVQIGGIGYTALKVCLLFLLGRRFGLQEKIEYDFERGNPKLGSSVRLIKFALIFIFTIELLGTFIFSTYLYLDSAIANNNFLNISDNNLGHRLHNNYGLSFYYGLFTAISSLNNAGWYLFGGDSFLAFNADYFVQWFIIIMTIFGGLGFPIYFEIYRWISFKLNRKKTEKYRLSLFSKISLITYFSILAIGMFALSMSELLLPKNTTFKIDNNPASPSLFQDSHFSSWQKFMIILFTSVSSRSTGYTIVNLQRFAPSSKFILSILMWIGGSPVSASGGIRTTTFFVALLFIYYYFIGIKKPHFFRKKISSDLIKRSYMVIFTSLILVSLTTLVVYTSTFHVTTNGYKFGFIDAFLESCSAFGTTGFTTGLTSILNIPSLIFIFILMFVGQLTMSGTLLSFAKKTNQKNYLQYPTETILIG